MNVHVPPLSDADMARSLLALINGYRVTQAIYVIVSLGIPDLLSEGPRGSADLATATGCDRRSLSRVLRALAAVGILREDHGGAFALTQLGARLRADVQGSRHAWSRFVGRPAMWAAWGNLLHTVRTGENAFKHVHGKDTWEFRASSPEESAIFDAAMRENSLQLADVLLAHYDFSRFGTIVDVGGGDGALLARILAACPQANGKLLDLPHVAARAHDVFASHGLADRAAVVPGSFFSEVPPEGDLYILKHVIHDWEDAQAATILRNCRLAMRPGARLILVERLVEGPNCDAETAFSDLNMMVNAGGYERTREELAALVENAGFELTAIRQLPASSILEVVPSAPARSEPNQTRQ